MSHHDEEWVFVLEPGQSRYRMSEIASSTQLHNLSDGLYTDTSTTCNKNIPALRSLDLSSPLRHAFSN